MNNLLIIMSSASFQIPTPRGFVTLGNISPLSKILGCSGCKASSPDCRPQAEPSICLPSVVLSRCYRKSSNNACFESVGSVSSLPWFLATPLAECTRASGSKLIGRLLPFGLWKSRGRQDGVRGMREPKTLMAVTFSRSLCGTSGR